MKREVLRSLALFTLGALFITGCYSHRAYEPVVATSPTGEVVVSEAPPAPRTEVMGVAPSAAHVWVAGYWLYRDRRWVWIPGHYELRPRAGATWVPGHWDHMTRGWVWTPGHWE